LPDGGEYENAAHHVLIFVSRGPTDEKLAHRSVVIMPMVGGEDGVNTCIGDDK